MLLKNVPVLKRKEWAGGVLEKFKGLEKVGESWEVSAHRSGVSKVELDGKVVPLTEFLKKHGKEFLGNFKEMPIMVKLLDVGRMLSVQVHPTDEIARELGETDRGKSEGWIALSGGRVYLGLKDYSKAATPENLVPFEVEPFDSFPIYPGTVHTAESVLLLEVSTPSDLTYRIYDPYGRETHVEKALKCIKKVTVKKDKFRLKMDEFCAEIVSAEEERTFESDVFNVVVSIGQIRVESKKSLELKQYESCLVFPNTEYRISGSGYAAIIYPLQSNN